MSVSLRLMWSSLTALELYKIRSAAEKRAQPALRLADGEKPRELGALERVAATMPDQHGGGVEREHASPLHPAIQPGSGIAVDDFIAEAEGLRIDRAESGALFDVELECAAAESPGGSGPSWFCVDVQRRGAVEHGVIGKEQRRGGEAAHLAGPGRDDELVAREQVVERTFIDVVQRRGREEEHQQSAL